MISVKVREKSETEVKEFLEKHKKIYPMHLVQFLGITDRHARRVLEKIRIKFNICEKYIDNFYLEEYLDLKR